MSVSTARLGDLCVTTKVLPASDISAAVVSDNPSATKLWTPEIPQRLKKFHAKALSVVLILTGILQISFGVIMSIAENDYPSLVVRSGAYAWGGLVVLVAGCITVASETKDNITLIKACLGSHVTNVVVGAVSLVIYIVQLHTETQSCWTTLDDQSIEKCASVYKEPVSDYSYRSYGNYVVVLRISVHSVVLIFSLIGFIISLVILALGWKELKEARYAVLK